MGAQPAPAAVHEFSDFGNIVRVVLDFAGSQQDLDVQPTADSLKVADKRSHRTLLNAVQLHSTIDASATQSSVSEGSATITLTKLDASTRWPALETDTDAVPSEQAASEAQTSQALLERDKVKALLTAAQSGSIAELQAAAEHFEGQNLADIKDVTGKTALHFAAQLGNKPTCQYLLDEQQVNINSQDEAGTEHNATCVTTSRAPPQGLSSSEFGLIID